MVLQSILVVCIVIGANLCTLSSLSSVPLHGFELCVWLACPKVDKHLKNQTYVPCPASPQSLSMGLNCFFQCPIDVFLIFFVLVFSRFWFDSEILLITSIYCMSHSILIHHQFHSNLIL